MTASPEQTVIRAVTRIHVAPDGFDPPYAIAVVERDGRRELRRVAATGDSLPRVGQAVVEVEPGVVRAAPPAPR